MYCDLYEKLGYCICDNIYWLKKAYANADEVLDELSELGVIGGLNIKG